MKYVFVLLLLVTFAFASQKRPPAAPLPDQVLSAKKIFVANGGGSDLGFDTIYAELKKWGRFELVGKPADADLVFVVSYNVNSAGTSVWSATNSSTGQTQVFSANEYDYQLHLVIVDPATKSTIFADLVRPRWARREQNREKNMMDAATLIVERLRRRVEGK